MGRTKQLVTWPSADGPKPLVAAAYDAICGICNEMIVVLGHEADAVAAALSGRTFHNVRCDPDAPMFDSIRAGIEAARAVDPKTVIVLQPGDHPEIAADTLNALMDWSLQRPVQSIIPEYQGRGGHPVLISPAVAECILSDGCPNGLGEFWKAHPELCVRWAVDDPGVCRDIDTPSDLPKDWSVQ
jgi:molybdenum cofactor cytidylyltransferase